MCIRDSLVPVRLESEGELEAGLAGSDDEYLPHTAGVSYSVLLGRNGRPGYSGLTSSA